MTDFMKTALAEGSYIAYTKGSCNPKSGAGGCACLVYAPDGARPIEVTCKSTNTTNNIAEMQAVISALKATPEGARVVVCGNSGYVKNSFERDLPKWSKNGWKGSKGKAVLNREKWEAILALAESREVTFHEVKTRAGDPIIDHVYQLARKKTEKAERKIIRILKGES
jgi:ribonuclease HI